jgi:hypothetical protein
MDATTAAQTIKEVEASFQRRQQEQTLQFDVSRSQPLAVKVRGWSSCRCLEVCAWTIITDDALAK